MASNEMRNEFYTRTNRYTDNMGASLTQQNDDDSITGIAQDQHLSQRNGCPKVIEPRNGRPNYFERHVGSKHLTGNHGNANKHGHSDSSTLNQPAAHSTATQPSSKHETYEYQPRVLSSIEEVLSEDHWSPSEPVDSDQTWSELAQLRDESEQFQHEDSIELGQDFQSHAGLTQNHESSGPSGLMSNRGLAQSHATEEPGGFMGVNRLHGINGDLGVNGLWSNGFGQMQPESDGLIWSHGLGLTQGNELQGIDKFQHTLSVISGLTSSQRLSGINARGNGNEFSDITTPKYVETEGLDIASSSGFVDDYAINPDTVFKNAALQQMTTEVGLTLLGMS